MRKLKAQPMQMGRTAMSKTDGRNKGLGALPEFAGGNIFWKPAQVIAGGESATLRVLPHILEKLQR